MADAKKTPRVRKQAAPSKLSGAKNGQKRAIRAKNKFTAPIAAVIGKVLKFFRLEFHPIKLPQNKFGKFLTKRRSLIPGFLSGAFTEIRQTTWPSTRETIRLTSAVFIFAIIFSIIVASLDFVLDKIFKSIIIG